MKVIETYYASKNILGVCLGMQAIAEFFGAQLSNLSEVQHGVQTKIYIERWQENQLYKNLPEVIEVGRYHSWVVDREGFPDKVLDVVPKYEWLLVAKRYPPH